MNPLSTLLQVLVFYFTILVLFLTWKEIGIFSRKEIGFWNIAWSFLGVIPITICTPLIYLFLMRSADLVPADLAPWGLVFVTSAFLLEIPVELTGFFIIATWFEKRGWHSIPAATVILGGITEFIYIFPMF